MEASEGQIRSPNYPDHYPPNKECVWIIKPKKSASISLRFKAFEIEPETRCGYDFLEVRKEFSFSCCHGVSLWLRRQISISCRATFVSPRTALVKPSPIELSIALGCFVYLVFLEAVFRYLLFSKEGEACVALFRRKEPIKFPFTKADPLII